MRERRASQHRARKPSAPKSPPARSLPTAAGSERAPEPAPQPVAEAPAPGAAPSAAEQAARARVEAAGTLVVGIAREVGTLCIDIADVVGHTQTIRAAFDGQNQRLSTIGESTEQIVEANRRIAAMAQQTSETAGRARDDIGASGRSIHQTIGEVAGLVSAVEESGSELSGVEAAVQRVSAVTSQIRGVARQTNFLALNAAIEAARAGEAGRGFAVVAGAVKALAKETAEATAQIDATLESLTAQVKLLSERMGVGAKRAALVGRNAGAIGEAVETVGRAVGEVFDHAAAIARESQDIAVRCDAFHTSVDAIRAESGNSTAALNKATVNVERVLGSAEKILMQTASSGHATPDTPFIEKAKEVAAAIEARFAEALAAGELTLDDLFDAQLQPIAGTSPQQFMTRYIPFLDRAITPLHDPVLAFDKRVVFCAPTDHNRMIPCHNPAFRHPQGPDPIWNAAHSRNRRVYPDKTAAAVATSHAPFLLQTYRRDMGGGVMVLMKDASAPIFVRGRLWGGLRVCYVAE